MQTFLPFSDFDQTAKVLDNQRLGKQRLEAFDTYQINLYKDTEKIIAYNTIDRINFLLKRYGNHPAVGMWRGYNDALLLYGLIICKEYSTRKKKDGSYFTDNMANLFKSEIERVTNDSINNFSPIIPEWIRDDRLNSSHRSNLLRKDYDYYSKFNWKENNTNYMNEPYFWTDKYGWGKQPSNKVRKKTICQQLVKKIKLLY